MRSSTTAQHLIPSKRLNWVKKQKHGEYLVRANAVCEEDGEQSDSEESPDSDNCEGMMSESDSLSMNLSGTEGDSSATGLSDSERDHNPPVVVNHQRLNPSRNQRPAKRAARRGGVGESKQKERQ